MRPDIAKRFEQTVGKSCEEFFGDYTYVHKKSGRRVTENIFPFHSYVFQEGLIHAENVGGDIEKVLNRRFVVGAFPVAIRRPGSLPVPHRMFLRLRRVA